MIQLENAEKFEKLAKNYPIKYIKSIDPWQCYKLSSVKLEKTDMKLVLDCLYANIPTELRVKNIDDEEKEREI